MPRAKRWLKWMAVVALLWVWSGVSSFAAGPRWVTGPPYFTTAGRPVSWYTDTPKYFTDPGDLSATVNHAAADALVATAAGVWNVPTSRLGLTQGGSLDEPVSGANTSVSSSGVVFPADVQASNGAAKQIAVIYDRDGAVTDLLLGAGASDPSGCRQSGVTESVDSITPDGLIRHAVLVLNGRCTGSAPEQQTQLQYQLMRAFGRVLGLSWSQTNDNVFTGTPTPTQQQALHWPVMHPIDILCGPYTYQCMPQPFTLRDDDVSGLALLYPIAPGQAGPGKTDTLLNAFGMGGRISFPDGQGMQGVNVVGRRFEQYQPQSQIETWETVSSVSGFLARQTNANAVMGLDASMSASQGTTDSFYEGWYHFSRIPMLPGDWEWVIVQTQPVNPLYVGTYAVGPYAQEVVQPSGSAMSVQMGLLVSNTDYGWYDIAVPDAAARCVSPSGSEGAPATLDPSGWWTGQLCGYGQVAWSGLTVKTNRSLTVEVTAQDELGSASAMKAMPVIGLWRATDGLGVAPDFAATDALNGVSAGLTTLGVSGLAAGGLRLAIADRRGDGRPDYHFGGRVLYADTVTPSSVGSGGGLVTVTGMGFRAGNAVLVNGVAATVQSWSPTAIAAMVPASRLLASGVPSALVADVTVQDLMTGGTTVMTGALSYAAPLPELMRLVSVPVPTTVGTVAATAFAVRVTQSDGVTPVVGEPVVFSASGAGALLGACGAASCTAVTDATGLATVSVTPMGVGGVGLSALGDSTTVTAACVGLAPVRTLTLVRAVEYVAEGAVVAWSPQVQLADNSAGVAGLGVVWTGSAGVVVGGAATVSDQSGQAAVATLLGPVAAGTQATGSACAWLGTVCAGFAAQGVALAALQLDVLSGAGQALPANGSLGGVTLRVSDGLGHPVAGAAVAVHQTVEAGEACPALGRCPAQPVLLQAESAAVSDGDGLVSVVPLQIAGKQVTNLVMTVGTQGFVSLSLSKGW